LLLRALKYTKEPKIAASQRVGFIEDFLTNGDDMWRAFQKLGVVNEQFQV
jgi:hypothetical protein